MNDSINIPPYWQQAIKELSDTDPVLAAIIKKYRGETLQSRGDGFYTLARSIVGQQISVKAADSVWVKLMDKVGKPFAPRRIELLEDEQLRSCGLSRQKIIYLREVAAYFESPPDFFAMDDVEILASLTSIKGVGKWTAEMFMIFHLLRPNVLPLDDIGLLKAIGIYYGDGKNKASKVEAKEIAKSWAPYCSVATWYLWRALDPVPVEY